VVEQLLENKHLEKDQQVNPPAPYIAPAILIIALVKKIICTATFASILAKKSTHAVSRQVGT